MLDLDTREDGLVITLTDGDAGNLLPIDDVVCLGDLLDKAQAEGKTWAVIRQRGKDFCLGRALGPLSSEHREALIGLVQKLQALGIVTYCQIGHRVVVASGWIIGWWSTG